ncbi:MAG TPA: 4Fe-4S dicluster domain-containing protein, partial [Thermoguttaceae bacterium]|nr:4Fe-4S dicluster domain-containing protein [Thermoguttaceae bacterium]
GGPTCRWQEAVRWLVRIGCLVILTAILWPGGQLWPSWFRLPPPQWIQRLESPESARLVPALSPWIALSSLAATHTLSLATGVGLGMGLLVVLRRRWLCRWMCPMGVCTELAGRAGRLCRLRAYRLFSVGQWIALLTLGGAAVGYPLFLWMDPLALWAGWISPASGDPSPLEKQPNPVTADQTNPAHQTDLAKEDDQAGLGFAPANLNWFAVGAAAVLMVSFLLPGLWCGRLCPLGGLQEVLWQLRQMAVGAANRAIRVLVALVPTPQRREDTASPLGGRGRPARGWPGEGEKKAAWSSYFPLTLTLSRQGRGEKKEAIPPAERENRVSAERENRVSAERENTESLPAEREKSSLSAETLRVLPPGLPEQPSQPGTLQSRFRQTAHSDGTESGWKLGRRFVLAGLIGAVWAGWVRRLHGAAAKPLRPPGAANEEVFSGLCIRCGNCIRACPSRIILPQGAQHGLAGFLTPFVHLDQDYCREDCTRCTQACPTGALRPILPAEKPKVQIGLARVDMGRCLLGEARECFICRDRCPYQAIRTQFSPITYMVEVQINPARCNGCGACQVSCPTWPRAIVVEPL